MKTLHLNFALAAVASLTMATSASADESADRGAYVAIQADCNACHMNPERKDQPFAGGYRIHSPFGEIVASNISPSKEFGIGTWTEAEFARAIREGVSKDGSNLYPAMPYVEYSQMSDGDIHDLYNYFMKSVKPVDAAPEAKTSLEFPFNFRIAMTGWNMLFRPTPGSTKFDLSDEISRGKYLTDVMGHCTTCHTPRGFSMNSDNAQYLGGSDLGGWYAPNITSDKMSGVGSWSIDEMASYLKNGRLAGKAQAAGPMAEAVEHSFSKMRDEDLHAIAAYLKTVPAITSPAEATSPASSADRAHYDFEGAKAQSVLMAAVATTPIGKDLLETRINTDTSGVTDGARLYVNACATCHMPNGAGTSDTYYPSLFNNATVDTAIPNNLVMTILEGVHRDANGHHAFMPGFREDFTNEQVASLANYVSQTYGGGKMNVTSDKVEEIKNGGATPLIKKLVPWAIAAGLFLAAAILALLVMLRLRRASPAT
ncbi:c-type cytochrome [Neorhizobium sp. NPDC001467]|uniref:c-type cytochrome n=1 Tax=Neorhizobium sp. NPDC001467 TaxID=3390595 RepID=UPI003CFCAF74